MPTKEPGYVYILTNPSFREDWVKIGKSSRPVDIRSKELDNTAVLEAYGFPKDASEADIVARLFKMYQDLTN